MSDSEPMTSELLRRSASHRKASPRPCKILSSLSQRNAIQPVFVQSLHGVAVHSIMHLPCTSILCLPVFSSRSTNGVLGTSKDPNNVPSFYANRFPTQRTSVGTEGPSSCSCNVLPFPPNVPSVKVYSLSMVAWYSAHTLGPTSRNVSMPKLEPFGSPATSAQYGDDPTSYSSGSAMA